MPGVALLVAGAVAIIIIIIIIIIIVVAVMATGDDGGTGGGGTTDDTADSTDPEEPTGGDDEDKVDVGKLAEHNRSLMKDGQVISGFQNTETGDYLINVSENQAMTWHEKPADEVASGYKHKLVDKSDAGYGKGLIIYATGPYEGVAHRSFHVVDNDNKIVVSLGAPTSNDRFKLSDDGTKLVHIPSGKALSQPKDRDIASLVSVSKAPRIKLVK